MIILLKPENFFYFNLIMVKLILTNSSFRYINLSCLLSGNNSVVECDLAKVEVAGSNPVSRSTTQGGLAKG